MVKLKTKHIHTIQKPKTQSDKLPFPPHLNFTLISLSAQRPNIIIKINKRIITEKNGK